MELRDLNATACKFLEAKKNSTALIFSGSMQCLNEKLCGRDIQHVCEKTPNKHFCGFSWTFAVRRRAKASLRFRGKEKDNYIVEIYWPNTAY